MTTTDLTSPALEGIEKTRGFSARGVLRFLRREPSFTIGLFISLVVVLAAIFARQIAPYDPNEFHSGQELLDPNGTFFFGTDRFGRDIFSRVLHAIRVDLQLGLVA